MQKWLVGDVPFYLKFWAKLTALERNRRFSMYFRSYSFSAVTPTEKVQLTVIGSPVRAFQWAQDKHRSLSLSPQRWPKNAKCLKIWTISCDNSETVRNRMSESRIRAFDLYRPRLPWMTLNGIITLILRFLSNSIAITGRLCHSGWIDL